MRLTLRTLLAYSDDILDPADHEELGKKIEASDFATELIHRSRDTVRRLRLGAPDVFAGSGDDVLESTSTADANAVAEYLDNTLPAEEVAEFERMCLEPGNEADMHLAEVASCHHVLTMVLGEPAEIDVDVRRRIYELPKKHAVEQQSQGEVVAPLPPENLPPLELPSQEVLAAPQPSAGPPVHSVDTVFETAVPDYLRVATAERQRKKRWTVAAVLLALVAGAAGFLSLRALMQPEVPAEVAEGGLDEIAIDSTVDSTGKPETEFGEEHLATDTATPDEAAATSDVPPEPFDSSTPALEADKPSSDVVAGDGAASGEIETKPAEMAEPEINQTNDIDAAPGDVAAGPVDSEPATATPGPLPLELPETNAGLPSTDPEMADLDESAEESLTEEPSEEVASRDTDETDLEVPAEPAGPKQLGNYLGNDDVLLWYDAAREKWIRLPPRSALKAGDSLIALPKFRPHVVLAGVNVYLSGGTRIDLPQEEFALADQEVDLELAIVYGRILLNAGLEGSRVALNVGNELRRFSMAGSTSLAVDVQRVFVPGKDNEQQASPIEATWYLTSGAVEWPGPGGEPQTIEAPTTWKTVAGIDDLPQPIDQLPEWIDQEPMTDMERRARVTIAEELTPGEPVGLTLLELNDQREKGRRYEVRTLAAESSVYVGEFEPFVKSLGDKDQRRAWDSHIKTLRQALALSPQVAGRVREAFVNTRGEAAANDLMEMIAGYDGTAIRESQGVSADGPLVKLIRWLESDSLDYRVLAIYNLNEITGTTSLKNYHPGDSSRSRKIAVAKIWESYESNELLPNS